MLCFTGLVVIFISQVLEIICVQNNQTIKIVDGFNALRQKRGEIVEPNNFINGLFSQASDLSLNEKEKSVKLLGYKKEAHRNFLTNDDSRKCSFMNGGHPISYDMQLESKTALRAYDELMKSKEYRPDNRYKMPKDKCKTDLYAGKCDKYDPWRSLDGSCNNLEKPWWGTALSPFQRFAEPAYDDGYNAPRKHARDGSILSNARKIALYVHSPYETQSEWSHLFIWFGQFVLHDVTKTASTVYGDGKQKWCQCGTSDLDCFNIPIPYEDIYNKEQECMTMTRSAAAARYYDCYLGPREQLNMVTSWLDLGLVYGNDVKMNKKVRAFKNGKLKTSRNKYSRQEQLPYRDGVKSCLGLGSCGKCTFTGDSRHEDNGFINAIHTIFVREHNRVAKKLLYWNPYWDDEITFQEARRIVIAEYQNIVYAEFLPLLVGQKVAHQFDLLPNKEGYFMGYDPKEDPSTYNEFAVAAARYGHTLAKNYQLRADVNYNIKANHTIDYYIFNPELPEYGGGIESLVRGGLADWSYNPTSQVNDRLNNYLTDGIFYKETGNKKFSLPALNIQRGRDHGLQPYVVYRELCGLSRPYSFDDLTNMPKNVVSQLRKVYKSVEDIDLWTGMVSEYHLEDAAVGPTQACVLAKGFRDWKYADRWWFENGNDQKIRFTANQLNEIRSTSFARILCDNVEVEYVQRLAFLWPNEEYNPWTDCKKIAGIDFSNWKESEKKSEY